MRRIGRLTLAAILSIAVLAVPSILAAAKELGVLTVSGPGINGALALNNPQGLMQLQQYGFFDTTVLANVPQNLGEGYQVIGYLNLDGKPVPFVQGIYYPAIAGEQGYMHFTGGLDGSTMKATAVDRWSIVSPAAGAAFSKMVAAQGITLQIGVKVAASESPVSVPAASALPEVLLLVVIAGGTAMLLAGGVRVWRRRTSAQ